MSNFNSWCDLYSKDFFATFVNWLILNYPSLKPGHDPGNLLVWHKLGNISRRKVQPQFSWCNIPVLPKNSVSGTKFCTHNILHVNSVSLISCNILMGTKCSCKLACYKNEMNQLMNKSVSFSLVPRCPLCFLRYFFASIRFVCTSFRAVPAACIQYSTY